MVGGEILEGFLIMSSKRKLSKKQRDCILDIIEKFKTKYIVEVTPTMEKNLGKDLLWRFIVEKSEGRLFIQSSRNRVILDNLLIEILTPILEGLSKDTKDKVRKLFY
ncbi:hypothetical protein [Vibrio phage JSF13]|nr:hypothetical protein TUST1-2_00160 [Vibrio phage ICP1_2001_A]ADX89441.1 hypothetical protein TUST1-10_00145 [Vibrio phage ICP1_2004_A]APD17879.1 hypothetical protein [Vibrio phage JSF4]ASV41688.1 hypothetical protein [Vibrio phage JSF1]ASV42057.1 hypothetical protein [Vibrio phage JSF2]ASV42238.1 hypothetical protein [Vibrio phage JSF13]